LFAKFEKKEPDETPADAARPSTPIPLKPFVLRAFAPACRMASLAFAFWSDGYLLTSL
jgi:hypothetical protein